jgi:hypothetical protein
MNEAICKGSWWLGSACGKCERCHEEARKALPPLIKQAKAMRETLVAIQGELMQYGRLVSNPRLTALSISAVIEPES